MKNKSEITLVEEKAAFYYWIGRSISQWAHVEGQLRHVVAGSVNVGDSVAVGRAFLSLESFHAKRKFADHLIGVKHKNTELAARWEKLSEGLKTAATNRNKLVHHKPVDFYDDSPGRRVVLVQWIRDKPAKAKRQFAPQQAVGLLRVAAYRADFHNLTTALVNFYEASRGRPEPFPHDRTPHPSDLRDLVDEMLRGVPLSQSEPT